MASFEIARRLVDNVWRTVSVDEGAAGDGNGGGGGSGAILTHDILFTEDPRGPSYAITAVDVDNNTLGVAGDHVAAIEAAEQFVVAGSTGNDTRYVVASASFGGGTTTIVVEAGPFDATIDGSISLDNPPPSVSYTGTFAIPAGGALFGVTLAIYSNWSGGSSGANGTPEGELHWVVSDDDGVILDAEQQYTGETGLAFYTQLDDWNSDAVAAGKAYPTGGTVTALCERSVGGVGTATVRLFYMAEPDTSEAAAS